MVGKLWAYLKNPVYKNYGHAPLAYKKKMFFSSLGWRPLLNISFSILTGITIHFFDLDLGEHTSKELFSKSIFMILLLGSIVAPIVEEIIFRAPLILFKRSSYFKHAFYVSALAFGTIHIFNFELSEQIIWLFPLLVAPQVIAGFFLGHICVKLGLAWSILLHSAYNTILFLPLILSKFLNIPVE